MSESQDLAGSYMQEVREAVIAGLDESAAPLPGFFRRRSSRAVYSQLAEGVMKHLEPVLRAAVTEAAEASSVLDEAEPRHDTSYEQGVLAGTHSVLTSLHEELTMMERTPQKALRAVERRLNENRPSDGPAASFSEENDG